MAIDPDDLKNVRMPLFSWDYEDCTEPEHWFLHARGYLDCSKFLFEQMAEERFDRSFHRAKAAVFLFEHALELFFKGAIAQAGGQIQPSHDLAHLYAEFRKKYPGKQFEFHGDIHCAVSKDSGVPQTAFPRYPSDRTGAPWPGHRHIDIAIWCTQVLLFSEDLARIQKYIKSRYPGARQDGRA
ncbi:MAG: hypothetical protein AB1640_09525 [bacterium]